MAKKSNNSLIIVGVIAVLVLIGVFAFVYAQQKDEPSQSQPTTNNSCSPVEGKDYVGLSESEAVNKAKSVNQVYRIVERDGEGLPVNSDRNECRVNFTVSDNKVTKVEFY